MNTSIFKFQINFKISFSFQRVFSEAEMMAKKYRQKLPAILGTRRSEPSPGNALNFDNEATMYANWRWFKFERESEPN